MFCLMSRFPELVSETCLKICVAINQLLDLVEPCRILDGPRTSSTDFVFIIKMKAFQISKYTN